MKRFLDKENWTDLSGTLLKQEFLVTRTNILGWTSKQWIYFCFVSKQYGIFESNTDKEKAFLLCFRIALFIFQKCLYAYTWILELLV